MSGRNSRSVGLVDCSFVPSSPPSRDQLVRHIALRKKQNGKASKMRLFSLYLPLNITHHADFAHLCSVFSAGSLNVIGYIQQKRHVFIHFAWSCSLSLSSTQFFVRYTSCCSYRRMPHTLGLFSVFVFGFRLVVLFPRLLLSSSGDLIIAPTILLTLPCSEYLSVSF